MNEYPYILSARLTSVYTVLQEWRLNGFGPENEAARNVLCVEQPSAADMQRTIETCDKNI